MTTIKIENSVSVIDGPRRDIYEADKALAVEVPGAYWARKRRPGWDGKWHPVNVVRGTFPTGILRRVREVLPLAKVENLRGEIPPSISPGPDFLPGIALRDYQLEAIRAPMNAELHGRGIIATGTGSGKTEIGIAFALSIHGPCLWITHRKDIFHQTVEMIERYAGETPNMIGDGAWSMDPAKKFTLAMPQTATKSDGDLDVFVQENRNAACMVLDEVHRTSSAKGWFYMAQMIPAYYKIGLSGTPETGDPTRDLRIEGATGPIIYAMGAAELARRGYIVPPKIWFHKIVNPAVQGDYREARKLLIEENRRRNEKIVKLATAAVHDGKRVLVVCDTIKHVRKIGSIIAGESIRSRIVTGKSKSSDRTKARKDIRSGAMEVLLATPIFEDGVNLPELDVVILAAGGKGGVRVIQRIGRGLRLAPGKTHATIHDFVDTGSRYTLKHSQSRMSACRKEGFEIVKGGRE